MADITERLPAELLSRIFSFLSHTRLCISNARLVCRTFQELSSPFLIPRVVFAYRLETVSKLHEVLNHPYFSRHVTELLYDASLYDEDLATDWDLYTEACETAPRQLRDPEWDQTKSREASLWSQLRTYCDLPVADGDGAVEDVHSDPDSAEGYFDRVYRMGCHKGFPDYHRRYQTQVKMRDAHLAFNCLPHVFSKLPSLKVVTFTDYRALIRPGESYHDGCHRLFGNTLAPKSLTRNPNSWRELLPVINATTIDGPRRVNELYFGESPFERPPGYCAMLVERPEDRIGDNARSLDPRGLPDSLISTLTTSGFAHLKKIFSQLRKLELNLDAVLGWGSHEETIADALLEDERALDRLRALLMAAAPTLTELSMGIVNLGAQGAGRPSEMPSLGRHGVAMQVESAAHADEALHYSSVFQSLILPVYFPRIRSIELVGWAMDSAELQTFLACNCSYLRELYLINNTIVTSSGWDASALAAWGGEHLSLEGVAIENWADVSLDERPGNSKKGKKQKRKKAPVRRTKHSNEELEALWLAGRHNQRRQVRKVRYDHQSNEEWYMQRHEW